MEHSFKYAPDLKYEQLADYLELDSDRVSSECARG